MSSWNNEEAYRHGAYSQEAADEEARLERERQEAADEHARQIIADHEQLERQRQQTSVGASSGRRQRAGRAQHQPAANDRAKDDTDWITVLICLSGGIAAWYFYASYWQTGESESLLHFAVPFGIGAGIAYALKDIIKIAIMLAIGTAGIWAFWQIFGAS